MFNACLRIKIEYLKHVSPGLAHSVSQKMVSDVLLIAAVRLEKKVLEILLKKVLNVVGSQIRKCQTPECDKKKIITY